MFCPEKKFDRARAWERKRHRALSMSGMLLASLSVAKCYDKIVLLYNRLLLHRPLAATRDHARLATWIRPSHCGGSTWA